MKFKKLKWERVDGGFDLKLANCKNVNVPKLKELLEKVELPTPEYNKSFNQKASRLFRQWFNDLNQPLREAAYTLLSNWFLTNCVASKSSRADHARGLWDVLFCSRPYSRLSDWEISGEKVVPQQFKQWWKNQQKCQDDC